MTDVNKLEYYLMLFEFHTNELPYYLQTGFYNWLVFIDEFWWPFGIIGGCSMVLALFVKNRKLSWLYIFIFIISFIIQPLLFYFHLDISKLSLTVEYELQTKHVYGYFGGFLPSAIITILLYQYISSVIDGLKDKLIKKTTLQRNQNTDIRNMGGFIPKKQKPYSVEKYFKKNKIFVGLGIDSKPLYLSSEVWLSSHVDLIGTTGSGKGVAAGVLLTQAAVTLDEAVIVLDPKDDEYEKYVLGQITRDRNVPYFNIDLTGEVGQWNPLANKTPMQIEELLSAAFGMSEKGTDADYYRLNDRKAARLFSKMTVVPEETFPERVARFFIENNEILQEADKFREDLEEISSLSVINVKNGLDLDNAIQEGAIIYVRGSMRNTPVLKLQKMFLLAVIQSCESRERENARHVCMFLDEFKYLISKPALEALGAIRDKGAHIMLAHQSIGDLRDCPKDIDPESVISSVNENCSLKLAYQVKNPDTAEWLARMSGEILVDEEIRHFESDVALTEKKSSERTLRQSKRHLMDTNTLLSLPSRCAVMYGDDEAKFIFTSPIKVNKNPKWKIPTAFENVYQDNDSTNKYSSSISEDLLDVD